MAEKLMGKCCTNSQILCRQLVYMITVTVGILYDTIRYKSLTWTRKLNIQLNLAHVARN